MKAKITQKIFEPILEKTIDENQQGLAYKSKVNTNALKKAYIETYGCQMNFSDTEIIASILSDLGYGFTQNVLESDLALINTCSIRENAEEKVWNRLKELKSLKRKKPDLLVGVLGCMAERLKNKLLEKEKLVDMVVGPDAYRDLPRLIETAESGIKSINVLLSREETYADISPIRLNTNGVSAFISIMRGCNNMCTFCVVPFTRGRERSRNYHSILQEAQELFENGYREVTLLGQNVDSYRYEDCNFAQLLEKVALISPELRVRFSTSHPKDITDEVLFTMQKYENICKYIHLPAQSGNSEILEKMNRGYTREWYLQKIQRIREILPDCAISTDLIVGFCGETEEQFDDTVSLMELVKFDYAYIFYYSERPGTPAAKKFKDDVPEHIKKQRLQTLIDLQSKHSLLSNQKDLGKVFKVLIEGDSKKSDLDFCGRNDQNKMVIFKKQDNLKPGDYVNVKILDITSATLKGVVV
jgi:tRNA-2-methylthio-N6-dimethylallyladenosine synthase